jgi:hypothetical protein
MRQARYPILERIGKVLHEQLSDVANEPLPERLTDLINYLGDDERARSDGTPSARPRPPGLKPLGT